MPRRKIEIPAPADGAQAPDDSSLPVVCRQVRYYRELRGLEQKELAKRLGITGNAVCNWENGRGRPDINLIPSLCEVLSISLYDLFRVDDPSSRYTSEEKELISSFRRLTPGHRAVVLQLSDSLGQIQSDEGTKPLRCLKYFARTLAAGIGDPTEFEEDAEPFYVYDTEETRTADYVFRVNGDSMEPEYHHGDLVLIARIPETLRLREGEIGAFIAGNETYIKILGSDGLYSLNPAYPPLRFSDEENVYLIGRVTGVLSRELIAETDASGKQEAPV